MNVSIRVKSPRGLPRHITPSLIQERRVQPKFHVKSPDTRPPTTPKSARNAIRKPIFSSPSLQPIQKPTLSFSFQSLPNAPISPSECLQKYQNLLTQNEIFEVKTYQDIYYIRQTPPQRSNLLNLKSEFFPFVEGDHIKYQYQQMSELGHGAFGSVIKCFDHKTRKIYALKFIKDTPKMYNQTRQELESLDKLQTTSDDQNIDDENSIHISDINNVIHFYECFIFRGFYVLVFELLGSDMMSALKFNNYQGLAFEQVRTVAKDITKALAFSHSKGIIHCDIRPHNILWTTFHRTKAKLIDFGCSHKAQEKQSMYVQSRCYRAPEVILGFPVTPALDIWSFACVLAELATGQTLFNGQTEEEQLMLYASVIGPPPDDLLSKSPNAKQIYDGAGRVKKVIQARRIAAGARPLTKILNVDEKLLSFIESCLVWDPEKRPTAKELLSHPFLS